MPVQGLVSVSVVAAQAEVRRISVGSPGTGCLEDLEDVVGDEGQATLRMVVLQTRAATPTQPFMTCVLFGAGCPTSPLWTIVL